VESCCIRRQTGITESSGLSAGDVFVDNKGNCWFVISTTTGTVDVIFDTYIGTDCQECINAFGCYWQAECCNSLYSIIINDLGLPPLTPGDSIKDTNDLCYTIVNLILGPPSNVAAVWYRDCDACYSDGGAECK
jgi:hypothetical protein